jgi:hypothetical protein
MRSVHKSPYRLVHLEVYLSDRDKNLNHTGLPRRHTVLMYSLK